MIITILQHVAPSAKRRIGYAICRPDSIMEPIDWAWAIYCSNKSDIFGHAYMGMIILFFIEASDFSNLPTLRQVVYLGRALLHILEFAYRPLARYSGLFPGLNVLFSTPVFVFTCLWSIKSIIEAQWTAGGLSAGGEPKEKEKKSGLRMRFPSESLRSGGVSSGVAPVEGIRNRREGGLRAQSLGYAYTRGRGRVE